MADLTARLALAVDSNVYVVAVAFIVAGGSVESPRLELLPGLALYLHADLFGLIFALLASGLWIITSLYSVGYMRAGHYSHQSGYFACFAVCLSAAIWPSSSIIMA